MAISDDVLVAASAMLRERTPPDLASALRVARALKGKQQFETARKVLERARDHASGPYPDVLKLFQQLALCRSKDTGLPYSRHEEALSLLRESADLESENVSKETLGIAGGILKRMWAGSGNVRYLMQSLSCYNRGRSEDGDGYHDINAAFLNDLLATGDDPQTQRKRCQEAQGIRERLVERMAFLRRQPADWWYLVTVAEALLGLHRLQDARRWLKEALAQPKVDDWEREATATQLTELSRLHDQLRAHLPTSVSAGAQSPASAKDAAAPATTILEVVRDAFWPVPVTDLGLKLGLALSGGGFRASLYHIGVLARLADEDLLRRVEVLSCVSGGSLVGAHYYLELRKLLQTKSDEDIERKDYIQVVRRVQESFLLGVQRNIRTRVLASPTASLAILVADQTRTKYLGELVERELYERVDDGHPKGEPRWLEKLLIVPLADQKRQEDFHPRSHNWRRRAKVPVLILNATTLNTGHLWQFTATWMGEPQGRINTLIDRRGRLLKLHYRDERAPPAFKRIRLGHAVAASACVPGLFEPLELDGLYKRRKVRLVDGGVFDNQGVDSLLGEDCQELFVSDASGPLSEEAEVAAGRIAAPLRSNSIAMGLVRERQYKSVWDLHQAGTVRRFEWVHFKQGGIGGAIVPWDGDDDGAKQPDDLLEERIAAIRTDLDSFSDVEACVLMAKGYQTIEQELARARPADMGAPPCAGWSFLAVEPIMRKEPGYERAHEQLLTLLGAGSQTLFKVWRIVPRLSLATAVAASLAMVWCLYWAFNYSGSLPAIPIRTIAVAAMVGLMTALVLGLMRRVIRTRATLGGLAITLLALVAWIPARLHLHVLDRVFLRLGKLDRLYRLVSARGKRTNDESL